MTGPVVNRLCGRLVLATILLAAALARESLLDALLLTRLQIETMLLDILDDVFLLDFSLKAAEGAFDCLAFLQPDLGQETLSSNDVFYDEVPAIQTMRLLEIQLSSRNPKGRTGIRGEC